MNKELQAKMKEDAKIAATGSEADFVARLDSLTEEIASQRIDVRDHQEVIDFMLARIEQLLLMRKLVLKQRATSDE